MRYDPNVRRTAGHLNAAEAQSKRFNVGGKKQNYKKLGKDGNQLADPSHDIEDDQYRQRVKQEAVGATRLVTDPETAPQKNHSAT